ncbi:MAG: hypothetical protein ABI665_05420 [Vicinamibacterales bacterium]
MGEVDRARDKKLNRDVAIKVWALPLTGTDRHAIAVAATQAAENLGAISHDSRWVAYQTTESGRSEVVVQGFPAR